jgi:hypothetical protein
MSKVTIKLPSPYLPLHESQSETSSTAGNGGVGKRKDSQKKRAEAARRLSIKPRYDAEISTSPRGLENM